MKEIVINTARQKKELVILLGCFLGAIALNILGILKYHTAWKELYTQWFAVLALTVVLYLLILIFRLLFVLLLMAFTRKKGKVNL